MVDDELAALAWFCIDFVDAIGWHVVLLTPLCHWSTVIHSSLVGHVAEVFVLSFALHLRLC